MNNDRLRELLDVCRNHTDLDDPQLQAAAEAVRIDSAAQEYLEASLRFDCAVLEQFQRTELPAGLENQVLGVLASAVTAGSTPQPQIEPASRFGRLRRSRSLWLVASGLAATILVVLVVSGKFRRSLNPEELVKTARTWPKQVDPGAWDTDLLNTPANYPVARDLNATPVRWQPCGTGLDPHTVVYQLVTSRSGHQGLLFVSRGAVSGLPVAPQLRPASSTQNLCIGAWEADHCVYVLTVDGTTSDYRRFVDVLVARRAPPHAPRGHRPVTRSQETAGTAPTPNTIKYSLAVCLPTSLRPMFPPAVGVRLFRPTGW